MMPKITFTHVAIFGLFLLGILFGAMVFGHKRVAEINRENILLLDSLQKLRSNEQKFLSRRAIEKDSLNVVIATAHRKYDSLDRQSKLNYNWFNGEIKRLKNATVKELEHEAEAAYSNPLIPRTH